MTREERDGISNLVARNIMADTDLRHNDTEARKQAFLEAHDTANEPYHRWRERALKAEAEVVRLISHIDFVRTIALNNEDGAIKRIFYECCALLEAQP